MKMHHFRAADSDHIECVHCGHIRDVRVADLSPCRGLSKGQEPVPEILADWQEAA